MPKIAKNVDLGNKVGTTTEKVGQTAEQTGDASMQVGDTLGATGAAVGAAGVAAGVGGSDNAVTTGDLGLGGPADAGVGFHDDSEGFEGVSAGAGLAGTSQVQTADVAVGEQNNNWSYDYDSYEGLGGGNSDVGGAWVDAGSGTPETLAFAEGSVTDDSAVDAFAVGATQNSFTATDASLDGGGLGTETLQVTENDATYLGTSTDSNGTESYLVDDDTGYSEPLDLDDSGEAGLDLDTDALDVG